MRTRGLLDVLALLLHAQLGRVAALPLPAVGRADAEASVALAANLLLRVVLPRKRNERRLDDTPAKAQHKVERALLLDVVVGERPAVLELLTREDEALLVRGDALLVLDLRLHVVDGVG
eukprot:CAMPEP_0170142694 /NCGR_PEP_ID=MMETSP0033_2-20121228/7901_1 /TAXON_ID=195969 /ORGANISM="Dolichomastix tenuilepis, Strain CCMP3274" /LENGTH=118 /DNA_ID=CAMNT_0010379043 /DNA_START=65 /DNA_END=418 /DNA_ORIENTATION=-